MSLLYLIPLAWWFTNFEPLQAVINKLFSYSSNVISLYIHSSFGCIKCVAFWLTILTTQDFLLACQAALLSYILDECLHKLR